jgi:Flp pilus assembly protein TadG
MAAMMLPLLAFAGGAIDVARLYTVKARLQQACDAGVLAGRKSMTDSTLTNTTLDPTATKQAQDFFKNNFSTGWFSTTSPTFTPTKTSDAQVSGTASVVVPMSIMSIFGFSSSTINVQCQATYDIADTDIIFVLDTTGSMACLPADSDSTCNNYVGSAGAVAYSRPSDSASGNDSMAGYAGTTGYYVPEKSGSRIAALRSAVLNFYDTMAANVDSSTHVRYGFVTYTSTVNAGKAIVSISPSYMIGGAGNGTTAWSYQSRYQNGDATSSSNTTYYNVSQSTCNSYISAKTYTSPTSGTGTTVSWTANSNNSTNGTCVVTKTTYTPKWIYAQVDQDVSAFVTGAAVDDPTEVGSSKTVWLGCVEERFTTPGASSFSTTNLPADLDPDLIPSSKNTSWRPMWPEVEYARNNYSSIANSSSTGDSTSNPNLGTDTYYKLGYVSCGKPVKRLGEMTRAQVSTYVNAADFRAIGGTYHDTGMIWGTRMLSPNGIFGADTKAWTGRQTPNRVIVFLTDGDMAPSTSIYGLYGTEYYDRHVTNGDFNNIKAYHNARFLAECAKAKALNIDVWTVSIDTSASTQMQSCATTTAQALYTTDGGGLSTVFAKIAKQIAMLRITQ